MNHVSQEIMRETIMELQSGVKDTPDQLQIEDQPEANQNEKTGARSASFVESLLASGK